NNQFRAYSVGTGRTGVRPAPDVPRGRPPHSFLRQEGPANPSAANFPQSALLRLLPTRETLAQQYACWRRRISLRDGAQCDRAYVATGAYIRSCELSGVVERAHSNVARKTKEWVEHKIRHAVGTRGIIAVPAARAVTRMLDTKPCQFRHYFEACPYRK